MEDFVPKASALGKPINIGRALLTLLLIGGSDAAAARAPVCNLALHLKNHTTKFKKGGGKGKEKGDDF